MAEDAREFWQELERGLPEGDRENKEEIARSVLGLLRRRITSEEAQHLKREFPDEVNELWAEPGIGLAEERSTRAVETLDHDQFIGRVREMAELPDMKRAAQATAAVFGAVRQVISDTKVEHVEQQLPSGLKELWIGEHARERGGRELGESVFWDLLSDRLDGRVRATKPEIASATLHALKRRLPQDLAERLTAKVPSDLRGAWRDVEAGSQAEEPAARFVGEIAQELGLENDLDQARHAAKSAMGALRRTLPDDVARKVENALPEDLQGYWEAT